MGKEKDKTPEVPIPPKEVVEGVKRAILSSILRPPVIKHPEFEPPKVDYGVDLSRYGGDGMVFDPYGVGYAGLRPGPVPSEPVEVSDSFLDIRVQISVESGNMGSPQARTVTLVPPRMVVKKICGPEADRFLIDPDSRKRTIMGLLDYFCEEIDKMGKE